MNAYWILSIQFITRWRTHAPHLYVLMGIPEAYLVHYIELDLRFLNYGCIQNSYYLVYFQNIPRFSCVTENMYSSDLNSSWSFSAFVLMWRHCCTMCFTWVLMRKKKPDISNTGRFFCFNSIISYTHTHTYIYQIIFVHLKRQK